MTDEVAAPAVHVDSWKHWSLAEGYQRTRRFVPEGCGVFVRSPDDMLLEELSTGRIFDLPPRPPDAQAWWEANQARTRAPRSGGPWTLSGYLYLWNQGYAPPQRVTYMASFFGVSQVSSTNNVWLTVWPGIQPDGNGAVVLQPILERQTPGGTQDWYMLPTINGGGNNQLSSGAFPIHMPQGVWGVIREYGNPSRWSIGFYRGNKGNTGPALGNPVKTSGPNPVVCAPLIVTFADPTYGSLVSVKQGFRNPLIAVEIPGNNGVAPGGPYTCSDLNITAVYGGITLQQGPNKLPVQWFHGANRGAGAPMSITCSTSESIQNATNNGLTQLTVQYGG